MNNIRQAEKEYASRTATKAITDMLKQNRYVCEKNDFEKASRNIIRTAEKSAENIDFNYISRHMPVVICEKESAGGGFIHSSLIYRSKNDYHAEIYMPVIRRILHFTENSSLDELRRLTENDLIKLHTAHEYFHFLEFSGSTEKYKKLLCKRFIFTVRRRIPEQSEAAAHTFAMRTAENSNLNFPFFPDIFDIYPI